jgi:site-specific DNA recombinase
MSGVLRLAAGMVENAVIGEIRRLIRAPEIVARVVDALRQEGEAGDKHSVVAALLGFDRLWASLFPAEQARILRLLVERVIVSTEGVAVDLRNDGLGSTPRKEEALA